jgi:multidrug efflux system membrane fusion protein
MSARSAARGIPALFAALLSLTWAACRDGEEELAPVVRPVRTIQVFSSGASRVRRFSGVASSDVESRLSFRVPGTVRRVAVVVGDSVHDGQLIAELDPTDYQLELERARASLRQAEAEARNAESNYERVRRLWENNNAALSDLENARAGSESAEAAVQSLQNQVSLAVQQLGYTRLTAPAAGAIADVPVEVNENVQAGQQVALLTAGATPNVDVAIPEVLIGGVHQGESVSIVFDAIPGRTFGGRVIEVGVAAMNRGAAFPVTVRLDTSDQEIRSGMAAEVSFTFAATGHAERIEVPPIAVSEDTDGRFVFVVEPVEGGFGNAHRRGVEVGELTTQGLEITSGLTDGDLVVIAGVSQIEDGQRVRLLAREPAP